MSSHNATRREFLRRAAMLYGSVGATATPLALNLMAMNSAVAQTNDDYRAIVCLFMFGGNDSANMVLATDPGSWTQYQAARQRDPDPIALRPVGTPVVGTATAGTPDALGGVLPISPAFSTQNDGRTFALHPSMVEAQNFQEAQRHMVGLDIPLHAAARRALSDNQLSGSLPASWSTFGGTLQKL